MPLFYGQLLYAVELLSLNELLITLLYCRERIMSVHTLLYVDRQRSVAGGNWLIIQFTGRRNWIKNPIVPVAFVRWRQAFPRKLANNDYYSEIPQRNSTIRIRPSITDQFPREQLGLWNSALSSSSAIACKLTVVRTVALFSVTTKYFREIFGFSCANKLLSESPIAPQCLFAECATQLAARHVVQSRDVTVC